MTAPFLPIVRQWPDAEVTRVAVEVGGEALRHSNNTALVCGEDDV